MRRPEFLTFVTSAIHRADRPEIARVETVLVAVDDPAGLRITTADGDVLLLRVLTTGAHSPTVAPRPPAGPLLGPTATPGGASSRRDG